jgi:hypothetical protein
MSKILSSSFIYQGGSPRTPKVRMTVENPSEKVNAIFMAMADDFEAWDDNTVIVYIGDFPTKEKMEDVINLLEA